MEYRLTITFKADADNLARLAVSRAVRELRAAPFELGDVVLERRLDAPWEQVSL